MVTFKLANASKSYNTNVKKDPIDNFCAIQEDQKKAFEAKKRGKTVTNARGKEVKPNWFEGKGGVWFYTLKYGNRKLDVKGNNSVEVGTDKKQIPAAIDWVISEARDGMLTKVIQAVAVDYSKNKKK